jgi:hypothetical protein
MNLHNLLQQTVDGINVAVRGATPIVEWKSDNQLKPQVLLDRNLPFFLEHRFFVHINNILQLSMYHWMTYIQ